MHRRSKRVTDAEALLMSLLSPEQRKQCNTEHGFTVIGSEGGEYFLSTTGWSGNVRRVRGVGPRGGTARATEQCAHISMLRKWLPKSRSYRAKQLCDCGCNASIGGNPLPSEFPLAQHHLAQMMLIQADERRWNTVAMNY